MIETYQALAMRTAKPLPTQAENLVHAALGIASEVGELSEVIVAAWMQIPYNVAQIPEEIGDACWYSALMCDTLMLDFKDQFLDPATGSDMSQELAAAVLGRNPPALCMCAAAFAGSIVSVVKAHVIYGKVLDLTLLERKLALLITTLSLLSNIHDIPFANVTLAQNINKLRLRYPDKYSDVAAIDRADKLHLVK